MARSYVPPASLFEDPDDQRTRAHTYTPPAEFEDDEDEGGNLTAVHFYSSGELGEMVDIGDLGDLAGSVTAPPPSEPTSRPGHDALLVETYLAALGGIGSVPQVAVEPGLVPSLPLGPQMAFVLSRIDGTSSVEDVVDMSGLPRAETLRVLYELLQRGVIEVVADGPY